MDRTIKAIITTIDNLPNNEEQLAILRDDPLINQIIFVDQDSRDGTREWLDAQSDVVVIHRQNNGAGPGRNAGLDAAGEFDFVLMLDGGIRPLRGGTEKMLDYLERHPEVDVIAVEINGFDTDTETAWRRWPNPITDDATYRNMRLSHTAYALCRARAWDGLRFSEVGPFAKAGWGVDDDEMCYRWNEAGIVVHVVVDIHPYRRASGSFRRLFQDTGIWPNQYGSAYEERLVYCQQEWPQYAAGMQWAEPWLTVIVKAGEQDATALLIKHAHDELMKRRFEKPWNWVPNPYSIILWDPDGKLTDWAAPRRLRQHHGDTILLNEDAPDRQIVRRTPENEATWTGDFRVWIGADWQGAVRSGAFYYGLVTNQEELDHLLLTYNKIHQCQPTGAGIPKERREITGE